IIIVGAIVILFFSVIFTQLVSKQVEKREIERTAETEFLIARQIALNIRQLITFLESELKFTAGFKEVQEIDPVLCPLRLEELTQRINMPGLSFSRMDENGIIRFAYPQKQIKNVSVRDQPHVKETLKTHKEIVSNPILAVQGFKAVILHIPVFTTDSIYKGSIAALIPFDIFPKMAVERITITKGSYVWMVADDGTILYHPFIEEGKKVSDVLTSEDIGVNEILDKQRKGEDGTGVYWFRGVKKVAGFASVRLPGRVWGISVAAPYSEIIKPLNTIKWKIYTFSTFFLLFLFALLVINRRMMLKHTFMSAQLNKLKEVNQLYSDMLENVDYGIFIVDRTFTILSANISFSMIFDIQYDPENRNVFEVLPFLKDYGYERLYRESFKRGISYKGSQEFVYNGNVKFLETKLIPIFSEPGKVKYIMTLVKNISEEKKLERELLEKTRNLERTNKILQELAITDELTGLYNYRFFKDTIYSLFNWAKDKGKSFFILVMDLDRFKELNDTLGHIEGDSILALVGETIKKIVPPPGSVARYGGDEFVV
ncbi:MAG: diguanylate cyclase, partial [bacterium]